MYLITFAQETNVKEGKITSSFFISSKLNARCNAAVALDKLLH